jgi:hypothetical protein
VPRRLFAPDLPVMCEVGYLGLLIPCLDRSAGAAVNGRTAGVVERVSGSARVAVAAGVLGSAGRPRMAGRAPVPGSGRGGCGHCHDGSAARRGPRQRASGLAAPGEGWLPPTRKAGGVGCALAPAPPSGQALSVADNQRGRLFPRVWRQPPPVLPDVPARPGWSAERHLQVSSSSMGGVWWVADRIRRPT